MRLFILLISFCGIAMAVVINVKNDVVFKVYRSSNDRIKIGPAELKIPSKFKWDPKSKTIFLIHGMKKADELKKSIKEAFFDDKNHKNTTLIKVKWVKGTEEWIDVDVLKNAELVGERIVTFIELLDNQDIPVDTANMEFIGHGIGAHIAAIVSRACKKLTNTKSKVNVRKIIALDPARFTFDKGEIGAHQALQKTDAEIVEVFHTNGLMHGIREPIGHIDVYFNGGQLQPSCSESNEDFGKCSHSKSFEYFADYLKNNITGYYCEIKSIDELEKGQCNKKKKEMLALKPAELEKCLKNPCVYDVNTMKNSGGDSVPYKMYNADERARNYTVIEKHISFDQKETFDWANSKKIKIDKEIPTVIFLHGYRGGDLYKWMQKAYLNGSKASKVNLIGINWEKGAMNVDYNIVRRRVVEVGVYVGRFIDNTLLKQTTIDKIVLLGHSLGAHCAGNAGKWLKKSTKYVAPVIIALDPAGPGFNKDTDRRLRKSDAQFVLAMHTDASGFGFRGQIGSIDIYINGGMDQPECDGVHKSILDIVGETATDFVYSRYDSDTCDHSYAYNFYSGAIKKGKQLTCNLCKSTDDAVKETCDKKEEIYINLSDIKSLTTKKIPSILFLSTATEANKVYERIE